MDIEVSLRELLVLENPGTRFTDEVMSRLGNVPAALPRDGVVRLADARQRKRNRWILLGTLLVVGAAASTLPWIIRALAAPRGQGSGVAFADGTVPGNSEPLALHREQPETSAPGEDPRACTDADVLQGLLLRLPSENFKLGVPVPPELAPFKAPRQLLWIGSAEIALGGPAQVSTAYRTTLSASAAGSAVAGALLAGGWKLQGDGVPHAGNAFTPLSRGAPDIYCRAGQLVNVETHALDGLTYSVLTVPRGSGSGASPNACDPQIQAQHPAPQPSGMDRYMPTLQLPRDPATGEPVLVQGMIGPGQGDLKRRMTVSFTLDDTADNIARHFASQMASQGWRAETNWPGQGTAGSSWTRPGDADEVLHATLLVWALGDRRFTVVLQMVTTK